ANPKRAQELLDAAVASNDPIAIIQVAICYLDGTCVTEDRTYARTLLQQAAASGSSEACELLKIYFPN
ncbi:MAG: SEL1-like repeat protein, partial [Victivallales bacterium]|nr:SEL1-like repeat protein [Victivallales bacterium]